MTVTLVGAFSRATSGAGAGGSPDPSLVSDHAAFANELVEAARRAILPHWRQPIEVESKLEQGRSAAQSASPVTIADRAAERAMRSLIDERHPSHGICGEEYGSVRTDAEWVWVLDPVDGTKSFITGRPLFGTLIACLHRGVPVVGVIDQPILGERWVGVRGEPTTLNGRPVRATGCASLRDAMLFATTPDMFREGEEADKFAAVCHAVRHPNYGADCYAYALVASGYGADLVVEADLGLYDYCALVPVVEGAGGFMSDWEGEQLTLPHHGASKGRVVAAANEALHKEALQILGAPPRPLLGRAMGPFVSIEVLPALLVGVALGMVLSRGTF